MTAGAQTCRRPGLGRPCQRASPSITAPASTNRAPFMSKGGSDFLAKIRCSHPRALEDVLYQIKAVPGVSRTTSTVVLNTEFESV